MNTPSSVLADLDRPTQDADDFAVYKAVCEPFSALFEDPAKGLAGYFHERGCLALLVPPQVYQPDRLILVQGYIYLIRPPRPPPWAELCDVRLPLDETYLLRPAPRFQNCNPPFIMSICS